MGWPWCCRAGVGSRYILILIRTHVRATGECAGARVSRVGLGPATLTYLAAGVTDMRKGFEGLYGLVRDRLSCEPLSGHLFLFCNPQYSEVFG